MDNLDKYIREGKKEFTHFSKDLEEGSDKFNLNSLLEKVNKKNIHKEISFGKPIGKEIW